MVTKKKLEQEVSSGKAIVQHYSKHEKNDYYTVVIEYENGSHKTFANVGHDTLQSLIKEEGDDIEDIDDFADDPAAKGPSGFKGTQGKTHFEEGLRFKLFLTNVLEMESDDVELDHYEKHKKNNNYNVVIKYKSSGTHKTYPNISKKVLSKFIDL